MCNASNHLPQDLNRVSVYSLSNNFQERQGKSAIFDSLEVKSFDINIFQVPKCRQYTEFMITLLYVSKSKIRIV